jgi:hypothetical protein
MGKRKNAVLESITDGDFTLEVDADGVQRWRDKDGILVREGGPAVIRPNGINEWWRYPNEYSREFAKSECDRVDMPKSRSREFIDMGNRMEGDIALSNAYDPTIQVSVGFLDEYVEVGIDYYIKDENGNSIRRTESIYIERRDEDYITEELGGDTFRISYIVYRNGKLSPMDCTELDDSDAGPVRSYDDVWRYVDQFIKTEEESLKGQVENGDAFLEDPDNDPWLVAGFDEDDKETWSQKFMPDDAREWADRYFDYDTAAEWCVSFTPEEAYTLDRAGLSVLSATDWKDHGFSVSDTVECIFKGYSTPEDAEDD